MSSEGGTQGLIIDVPEQLSRPRRWTERGIAGAAVTLWLFALKPALMLAAWLAGFQMAHTHLVGGSDAGRLLELERLGAVALALSLLVLAWNRYQALRRRAPASRRSAPTDLQAMAAYFELRPQQLALVRKTRSLTVERSGPCDVVFSCPDGARFEGHHNPLGLKPAPLPLRLPSPETITLQPVPAPERERRVAQG